MVAIHGGMKEQTTSNIARDGAAKRPQTKFPITYGMKNGTVLGGLVKGDEGTGPDADPANVMSQPTAAKTKKSGPIPVKWGMDSSPNTHSPEMGSAVLTEAANLGRRG